MPLVPGCRALVLQGTKPDPLEVTCLKYVGKIKKFKYDNWLVSELMGWKKRESGETFREPYWPAHLLMRIDGYEEGKEEKTEKSKEGVT